MGDHPNKLDKLADYSIVDAWGVYDKTAPPRKKGRVVHFEA
jgi:hypothetical protein